MQRSKALLLDHFVGAQEHDVGHSEAERATSMICLVISMSAREGDGSPPEFPLWVRCGGADRIPRPSGVPR
jgi:hypothetical protein